MKVCPTCHCRTKSKAECPICGESLTYVDPLPEEREQLVWNRYLALHLLRHGWFALCCTGIILVRFLLVRPTLSLYHGELALLLLLSIGISLFSRPLSRGMQWKYSETYAMYTVYITKLFCGAAAVIMTFLPYFG